MDLPNNSVHSSSPCRSTQTRCQPIADYFYQYDTVRTASKPLHITEASPTEKELIGHWSADSIETENPQTRCQSMDDSFYQRDIVRVASNPLEIIEPSSSDPSLTEKELIDLSSADSVETKTPQTRCEPMGDYLRDTVCTAGRPLEITEPSSSKSSPMAKVLNDLWGADSVETETPDLPQDFNKLISNPLILAPKQNVSSRFFVPLSTPYTIVNYKMEEFFTKKKRLEEIWGSASWTIDNL